MSIWIRVGGVVPADEVAPHSLPTWETLADGGSGECGFLYGTDARHSHRLLRPGTLLEVLDGCCPLWFGRIVDYDRTGGKVTGRGIHVDATGIPAVDGSGATTRVLSTALATAQAAPWLWPVHNPYQFDGTATGEGGEPLMVAALFDQLAEQAGKRWGIHPDRSLYVLQEATTPTWAIAPDGLAFGATDSERVTHLVGRYLEGETYKPVVVGDGERQPATARTEDLSDRGSMTQVEATAVLQTMLDAEKGRTGWTGGVTLSADQVTRNGVPAYLPGVHARGTMMRVTGMAQGHGVVQSLWDQVPLAKTRYDAERPDEIYVEPIGTAPRTLAAVGS